MLNITREIAYYLLDHSKDFNLPSVDDNSDKPFTITNRNAIGSISPILVAGSDCKYLVEIDSGEFGLNQSEVSGYYLYAQSDFKKMDDVFEVPRSAVDRYSTNSEESLDITDCVIQVPTSIEKLTSIKVTQLDRLFELVPDIKECLIPEGTADEQHKLF